MLRLGAVIGVILSPVEEVGTIELDGENVLGILFRSTKEVPARAILVVECEVGVLVRCTRGWCGSLGHRPLHLILNLSRSLLMALGTLAHVAADIVEGHKHMHDLPLEVCSVGIHADLLILGESTIGQVISADQEIHLGLKQIHLHSPSEDRVIKILLP